MHVEYPHPQVYVEEMQMNLITECSPELLWTCSMKLWNWGCELSELCISDRWVYVSISLYRAQAIYNNLHGGHNLMVEESKSILE